MEWRCQLCFNNIDPCTSHEERKLNWRCLGCNVLWHHAKGYSHSIPSTFQDETPSGDKRKSKRFLCGKCYIRLVSKPRQREEGKKETARISVQASRLRKRAKPQEVVAMAPRKRAKQMSSTTTRSLATVYQV